MNWAQFTNIAGWPFRSRHELYLKIFPGVFVGGSHENFLLYSIYSFIYTLTYKFVYLFVGCCSATKCLNLNNTKWNMELIMGVAVDC